MNLNIFFVRFKKRPHNWKISRGNSTNTTKSDGKPSQDLLTKQLREKRAMSEFSGAKKELTYISLDDMEMDTEKILGSGRFGKVFEGVYSGGPCAIKEVIDAELVTRLLF